MPRGEKKKPNQNNPPATCPENKGNEKSKFHFLKTNTD